MNIIIKAEEIFYYRYNIILINMSHDNEILSDFIENVLNSEMYIRWVGITDQNGIIINEKHRKELITS